MSKKPKLQPRSKALFIRVHTEDWGLISCQEKSGDMEKAKEKAKLLWSITPTRYLLEIGDLDNPEIIRHPPRKFSK